jgi:RNA polymerase sigma factor (sigma-70 family)
VEASALPASVGLARARLGLGAPLLRLRSDEQLVSLFRGGNEDAFRVIHDRYRARMLAYARQMLAATSADPEDAVQEIFVRAYAGLRTNRRDLALRAWLYRIAHNRCVDELRRPHALAVEDVEDLGEAPHSDPHTRVEQREMLRRLIADVQRLPEQQRSALLMRELAGMPYADLSGALGVSVPAVKSLLVRARVGLVQASEARDTACASIREDLVLAHDRGVRASGRARRHLHDCDHCRRFRSEVQDVSRGLGLLLPALGPLGVAAKLVGIHGLGLGLGGGGSAAAGCSPGAAAVGTSAAAGGSTAAAGGTAAVAGGGALAAAGAGHVVTIIAATALAAGGAIGIQHEVAASTHHTRHPRAVAVAAAPAPAARAAPAAPRVSEPATVAAAVTEPGSSLASAVTVARALGTTPTTTPTSSTPAVTPAVRVRARPVRLTMSPETDLHAPADGFPVAAPTSTAPVTTTDPGAPVSTVPVTTTTGSPTTPGDPVSTTTPTMPVATTTTPGTSTDPASTVPVTSTTPISGSSTTTTTTGTANPGTATGIVPTVLPASTWGGGVRRRLHQRTWHVDRRGAASASATITGGARTH